MRAVMLLMVGVFACSCQEFDVASVKTSATLVGKDVVVPFTISPTGFTGHNVTLKRLIVQAYGVEPFQVVGGPAWLDSNEYDIEARTSAPASGEQMRGALRMLLAERFGLKAHTGSVVKQVYELRPDRNGVGIHPIKEGEPPKSGGRAFRGDMQQFANFLGVQLSIPAIEDPTRPSFASGSPVPVLDRTGL